MKPYRWVKKNPLITLDIVKAILLMVLAIAFVNFNTRLGQVASDTRTIQKQQQKTLSSLAENSKTRTQQITTLTNHIDCVVDLFSHPNHDSLTIKDIKGCKLAKAPSVINSGSGSTATSAPKAQPPKQSAPKTKSQTSHSSSSPSRPQPSPSSPSLSRPGLVRQIRNFLGL